MCTAPSFSGRLFGQLRENADAQNDDVAATESVVPYTLASLTPSLSQSHAQLESYWVSFVV